MAISYNHIQTKSGTTPSVLQTEGNWAVVTAGGNTVVTLTSSSGDAGLIFFDNGAANNYTLTINGNAAVVNPTGVTMVGWANRNGTIELGSNYNSTAGTNGILTEYTGTTVPSTPSTGITLFDRKRGNRHSPTVLTAAGVLRELQDALYNALVTIVTGNNSSNAVVTNNATFTTGTVTVAGATTATYLSSFFRVTAATATSAGSSNQVRITTGIVSRKWGFLVVLRFAVTPGAQTRFFAGMTSAATLANVETSANINLFGYGCDAAEANLSAINNDGTGTATKTTLGASYPVATAAGEVIEVRIGCKENDTKVYMTIERLSGSQTSNGLTETTLDASVVELPADTVMLVPQIWINNGTATTADSFTFLEMYVYKR